MSEENEEQEDAAAPDVVTAGQSADIKAANKSKETRFRASHSLLLGFLSLIMYADPAQQYPDQL